MKEKPYSTTHKVTGNENENIFLRDAKIHTETVYQMNGNINIYPCPWDEQDPLLSSPQTSFRGRITVDDDGHTTVRPYRQGARGPLYREKFATEHCQVMVSGNGALMERWRFPRRLSMAEILAARERERPQIDAYFMSRKEAPQW